MDIQAQHLLSEALKLPAVSREDLAVRLLGSLETPEAEVEEVRQAWVEEIDHRVAKMENRESAAIPIEVAWPNITGKPWRSKSSHHD